MQSKFVLPALFAALILARDAAQAQGLDIGGYQLIQSNTVKTYTFPAGTTVTPGGYVVVGRSAAKSSFESYWGLTLGTNVLYLNAANVFPKIDGGERFVLRDATPAGIDGPTPSTVDPVGRSIQRKNATNAATSATSWNSVTWSAGTPGSGGAGDGTAGLVIMEYSDAGSFQYEFVELYYDAAGMPSNIPPVWQAIPDKTITISNHLQFSVAATPTDGDPVTLTVSNAPAGARLDATNEFGTFYWTNPAPLGVYTTRFYAADDDGSNCRTVTISVLSFPTVRFAAAEYTANEDAGTQLVYAVISRAADATVQVAVAGTAGTNDCRLTSTTLVFSASGSTQAFVAVVISNDVASESTEYLTLTLTNPSSAQAGTPNEFTLFIRDNDVITIMSANLVTGSDSKYNPPGCRIMQGLKPDIVGIQEWNITNVSYRNFVDVNFGTNFAYYIEPQSTNYFPLPNGIISRWPILDAGEWADPVVVNRDFAWATIDIPGDRNLHVVCVHLYASGTDADREDEARCITNYIADAGWPANDYIVICGDLNTSTRTDPAVLVLTNIVSDSHKPADHKGDTDTNSNRDKPYDYVLPGPWLNSNHTTLAVSGSNFVQGIVFDSRLWTNPPPPILTNDSAAVNADHMAVMKAFSLGKTPPSLQPVGSRSVFDHNTLQFDVAATPTDGDTVTLTASNLPAGATFSATNERGSFLWTDAAPVGVYTTAFYAADVDGIESESVVIKVLVDGLVWINEIHYDNAGTDTNEGVEVAGTAGVDLSFFGLCTYNGDGTLVSTNPLSGTIDDEGCGFGAVWVPLPGLQNGPDAVALTRLCTNVMQFLSYEGVVVAVEGPAVELSSSDIGVSENGTEPVGRSLQLIGVGTNYEAFAWAGPTNAASPGTLNGRQTIYPCGTDAQQPPALHPIGDKLVVVSNTFSFGVTATDLNGDPIALSVSNAPAGSTFSSVGGSGMFAWTNAAPTGTYACTFYASDDDGADAEPIHIYIVTGTEPPVIETVGNQTVIEGQTLTFPVTAADAEDDPITLTVSNPPPGSTFSATNGDGTFTWTNAGPLGVYTSRFYAADKDGVDYSIVKFYVNGPTNPPVLFAIPDAWAPEGQILAFGVTATDVDGDAITLTVSNAPAGSSFSATGGNGTFTWTNPAPVGVYTARFYAADNDGAVSQAAAIRVVVNGEVWINEMHYDNSGTDTNEGVEIAGAAGVDLGYYSLLAYNGADGLVYVSNALSGSIDDERCGYGAVWVPMAGLQNGPDGIALVVGGSNVVQFLSYGGTIAASNGPAAGVTADNLKVAESSTTPAGYSLQLTGVGTTYIGFAWGAPTNLASRGQLNDLQWPCTNQPPYLFPIGARSVFEGNLLGFTVAAVDPDGDPITLSASNAPAGSTFNPDTGLFAWTNASPPGVYTTAFYAVDKDGFDSESVVVTVDPAPVAASDPVWINEIHYDNTSTDVGEGVEVAGPAGTDLSAYALVAYNGDNGNYYGTYALSGTLDDEGCGYGATWRAISGLQNGPADGLALVKNSTGVVQFLSYEGSLLATNGAANGMTSTDIGVAEAGTEAAGFSLQLLGTGTNYAAFAWAGPTNAASTGTLNSAQFILPCPGDADGDGLPSQWEIVYFHSVTGAVPDADTDGDGMNNWGEYVSVTIPTNAASVFTADACRSGTAEVVEFDTDTGRVYGLFSRTNLSAGDWLPVQTNIPGTGGRLSIAVTNEVTPKYYRPKARFP